ncbi:hypothetical protein ASG05_06380 [Frigoribacterium sp. Leaf186]|nr:hypothetical protein ASG05_06380 [Frigoribacterium sp. Leaf186]
MSGRRRIASGGAAAVAFGLLLTSCGSPASSNVTADDAELTLSTVDGVDSAVVDASQSYEGLDRRSRVAVEMTLTDGRVAQDASDLVTFVLGVAWSVGPRQPSDVVSVGFRGSPAETVDWKDAATTAGFTPLDMLDGSRFSASTDDLTTAFGPWPGDVPDAPPGIITQP